MKPLKNELPSSDKMLFVFYDFETTQDKRFSERAKEHVPNLVCVQQFCSVCENDENIDRVTCQRCGQRKHTFWETDPVGDFISYLCQRRPWVSKVIVIAHNAKAFDLHFVLNRAVILKWRPELIMNGLKIMGMKFEHLIFLDSCLYMPLPLRKLSDAFGLKARKTFYPHFNSLQTLDFIGLMPDVGYYSADEMSETERNEFSAWYEGQRGNQFNNRRVLEEYCHADVTVLRQASQIFRREFMRVGNIDAFLESFTLASACNRVFRKRFLRPDTIGLIPTGGYTGGDTYSKKAISG
jgi:hypothetical protein